MNLVQGPKETEGGPQDLQKKKREKELAIEKTPFKRDRTRGKAQEERHSKGSREVRTLSMTKPGTAKNGWNPNAREVI